MVNSECVFAALVTQHTQRTRRIVMSSVACPTLPYFFFTLFREPHHSGKKKKKKKRFHFISNIYLKYLLF
jgi:hypothetical protein